MERLSAGVRVPPSPVSGTPARSLRFQVKLQATLMLVVEPFVVAQVRLQPHHRPTGVTRHYVGRPDEPRTEIPPPVSLQIVQYPDDEPRSYLFYCDDSGEKMTDTLHDSVDDAIEQAAAEFGVLRQEWDILRPTVNEVQRDK